MLQNINIKKLSPHPNNPRKDLGDLTELTDSIKTSGILQNLTVIPWYSTITGVGADNPKDQEKMGYYVLIGHRRLAAAKLAGLETVPCSIVTDMDESTQIATMLLENIQRNDLTLAEQGAGFQLMLDLGDTFKQVSEKTGISESTIRRKTKIYKTFGSEALAKVQDRPINLEDYDKVAKIENPEMQAEVFNTMGTKEFDWAFESAITRQEKQAIKAEMVEILSSFATHSPTETDIPRNRENYWCYYEPTKTNLENLQKLAAKIKEDDELSKPEYLYCSNDNQNWISVWAIADESDNESDEEDSEAKKEEQRIIKERMGRHNKLVEKFEQARDMRISFVKKFRTTTKTANIVNKIVLYALLQDSSICETTMRAIFDIKHKFRSEWQEGDGETQKEALARIFNEYSNESRYNASDMHLIGAYLHLENERRTLYALNTAKYFSAEYKNNPDLDRIYKFLCELGYVMSSEEIRLMDGSHEYYSKSEQDEEDEQGEQDEQDE